MNILLVDDERLSLESIAEGVNWESLNIVKVFTATSVEDAKYIMEKYQIDILVSDIEMPGENGFQLIEWANENDYRPITILLTSYSYFSYAQTAITLSVSCYVLKPIKFSKLEEEIRSTITRRKNMGYDHSIDDIENHDNLFNKATHYISKNISRPISREDISSYVSLSPDHLLRLFKKNTGMTISEYINCEKIKIAKKYIVSSDLSISEVANKVGFTNYSYFTKVFKKAEGITPHELRKIKEVQFANVAENK